MMRKTVSLLLPLLGCLHVASAGERAASLEPRTVAVDCSRGAGIQSALGRASASQHDGLIIEIRGVCHEDVVLILDNVTLRGTDATSDGIRGVGPGADTETAVLTVRGANRIRVENLSIVAGARTGLVVVGGSDVELANCRIADNRRYGIWVGQSSRLSADATTVAGNGRGGVVVTDGSEATCVDCLVDDDGLFALWTQLGARSVLRRSRLESTSNWAVIGYAASEISMQDSQIVGTPYALVTRSHDGVRLTRVAIDGAIWLDAKSSVELFDASQTSNPRVNYILKDSSVRLDHGSTLIGPSMLDDFSTLSIRGGSGHAGDVTCSGASDAFCEDASMVDGETFGCEHCSTPTVPATADRSPQLPPGPVASEPGILEPQRR